MHDTQPINAADLWRFVMAPYCVYLDMYHYDVRMSPSTIVLPGTLACASYDRTIARAHTRVELRGTRDHVDEALQHIPETKLCIMVGDADSYIKALVLDNLQYHDGACVAWFTSDFGVSIPSRQNFHCSVVDLPYVMVQGGTMQVMLEFDGPARLLGENPASNDDDLRVSDDG